MTIIAGFVCKQGILFATDTKHTSAGWMQIEAGKMFASKYPSGGQTLFALSGHVHFAKMILQHCEYELAGLTTEAFTLNGCRSVIERVLREDYAAHIFPHPEPRPEVEFLIGAYSPVSKKCGLFSTDGSSVNRLRGYECRGTGAYLGHFLLREKYKDIQRSRDRDSDTYGDAKQIGAHVLDALQQIKAYDDSCGRSTDIAWMAHDGRMSHLTRLYEDPVDADDFEFTMTRLLTGELRTDLFNVVMQPAPEPSPKEVRKSPKRGRKSRKPSRA